MGRKKKRMNKKDRKVINICIMLFILCILGIIIYYKIDNNGDKKIEFFKDEEKLKIVDQDSNQRPIAVMYDNNVGYDSHAGLQDSYINYEIIVEGGLTRIMAIFKDKDVDLIGPVRSSRHYFLDYALESDAIYCHYGWSTFAESDIKMLKVNNINGLTNENAYYRDNTIAKPHNVFTDIKTLYKEAGDSSYDIETDDWMLLNYSTDEVLLEKINIEKESEKVEPLVANNISLKYSNNQLTSYVYDSNNKYYLRYMDSKEHIDKTTKEQLHYKNIIVENVENTTLDSYGRQDLGTVGTGSGYYITNGYALPITWSKSSRKEKTEYKYLDGSEIEVNDGNTFIQIVPINTKTELN